MTGQDVVKQALRLLGYTDTRGEPDGRTHTEVYKRSLAILNQLCCELAAAQGTPFTPLGNLHDTPPFEAHIVRGILPYGVAMHLAAAEGDGDNQQWFAALYDQKRTAMQHTVERRTDCLPRGCEV